MEQDERTTYVVPVALTLLQGGALEPEGTLPSARLGGVLGERKLAGIVVPRTEKVDSLDIRGSAKGEGQLNRSHFGIEKMIRTNKWVMVVGKGLQKYQLPELYE